MYVTIIAEEAGAIQVFCELYSMCASFVGCWTVTHILTCIKSEWTGTHCSPAKAAGTIEPNTRTLSGWSLGRLGPVYALATASDAQLRQIQTMSWIDPGSYADFTAADACDNKALAGLSLTPGQVLAKWLKANPSGLRPVL